MKSGMIKQCGNKISECHYNCCIFSSNFIVLYPGEYEKSKLKKNHLKIIDEDYHGGKKVVCTKICTSKDFKPLDCKSYPFFPTLDSDNNLRLIKGIKCPLINKELNKHKTKVIEAWKGVSKDKKIKNWIKEVKLVGYGLSDE